MRNRVNLNSRQTANNPPTTSLETVRSWPIVKPTPMNLSINSELSNSIIYGRRVRFIVLGLSWGYLSME